MMKAVNKYNGFTLIELIVVIVILGVLAISAAPRFLAVSSDARKAAIKSLEGTVRSTANLFHGACLVTPDCANAVYGGVAMVPAYGAQFRITSRYPDAGNIGSTEILEIDGIVDNGDFEVSAPSGEATRWSFRNTTNCYVQYNQPGSAPGSTPWIRVIESGC